MKDKNTLYERIYQQRNIRKILGERKYETYKELTKMNFGTNLLMLQLAEECSELSQACLKYVRTDSRNKPKGSKEEILDNFSKEVADVLLCIEMLEDMLDVDDIEKRREFKLERWNEGLLTRLGEDTRHETIKELRRCEMNFRNFNKDTEGVGKKVEKNILEKINTPGAEAKKEFIQTYESGMYVGKNVEDEKVILMNDNHHGMEIWIKHKEKPNWWEVVSYDKDGYQESVTYEHNK